MEEGKIKVYSLKCQDREVGYGIDNRVLKFQGRLHELYSNFFYRDEIVIDSAVNKQIIGNSIFIFTLLLQKALYPKQLPGLKFLVYFYKSP